MKQREEVVFGVAGNVQRNLFSLGVLLGHPPVSSQKCLGPLVMLRGERGYDLEGFEVGWILGNACTKNQDV